MIVKDMNKRDTPLVPISGGLVVMAGIFLGLMTFIFLNSFFNHSAFSTKELATIFAASTTILMITIVGFVDDLVIKKSKDTSSGLKQWQKPLLTLAAAIPLMAIKAGHTTMGLPFIGEVNFGILYVMLLIPIGVIGAANMVNMLAGFNGLETGLGIIYTGMLGLYAYTYGRHSAAIILFLTFAALIAFYYYNKFPAKILPGDSLTYLLGGTIATAAIIGNIEKAALIISIPFFIEFILKARSRFKAQSYGYYENGKIRSKYKKIYSLTHIFTKTGKFTEKQIVYSLIFFELIISSFIWLI
jgi:UDP-N-acetylglucosamine--dolichyl-phosphate N-acetylglucosaminephosphotransferase